MGRCGSGAGPGLWHPELSGLEPPPREIESSRQNILGQREMLYIYKFIFIFIPPCKSTVKKEGKLYLSVQFKLFSFIKKKFSPSLIIVLEPACLFKILKQGTTVP